MDNTKDITVLSLCAGYGGLEIGLARALQRLLRVVAVEVEAYALANLVAKAEEGKLAIEALWPDLRTFPAKEFAGCFDIITAGYPCQGESVAGKRLGKADPRWLWPHIERIIKAVRPLYGFFENVPGHLTLGFPTVYRSLRNLGYSVEAGLFTAAECGAPHRRQRLFILGYSESNGHAAPAFARSIATAIPDNTQRQDTTSKSQRADIARELADARSTEFQKRQSQQRNDGKERQTLAGSCCKWPARPRQPQYEWEEPRVVANSQQRCRRRQDGDSQRLQCKIQTTRPGKGQTQSQLGRAATRPTCRVDRLRLLGNGVVPQCAELAFRTLLEQGK